MHRGATSPPDPPTNRLWAVALAGAVALGHEVELELCGRRAVVVGLARSGVAAARLLARAGAHVVATDVRGADELGEDVTALAELGVTLELGAHRPRAFTEAQLVVVSPGVSWERPELAAARAQGVSVMAEVELGAAFVTSPLAAVTGTKGKSTTCAALGAMLAAAGFDARVGGNIGRPLTGLLDDVDVATRYVLELSSFQLEGCARLRPHVAVFLNLSIDHLDRHASFAAYAAAKARLFHNQTEDDWAVINGEDADVERLAARTRARVVRFFGRGAAPVDGAVAWLAEGAAWLRLDGHAQRLFDLGDVRLPGAHLRADLLAAAVAARLMGAEPAAIARAVAAFHGLENVLEHVGDVAGVAYFNDTKATNVDAALKSLLAFDGPLLVIMGGRYKGGDFADLREVARGHVRLVLAIGETRPLLRAAFDGVVAVVECESLGAAVESAHAAAQPGDTVLLAPGCSSFDMFRDCAARGQAFRDAVARLRQGSSRG